MLCTAPASTVVPQLLQPEVANGAASQPQAGAGASQPQAGAGAQQDDRRARSLARRPTRPPQVGAGSQQAGQLRSRLVLVLARSKLVLVRKQELAHSRLGLVHSKQPCVPLALPKDRLDRRRLVLARSR